MNRFLIPLTLVVIFLTACGSQPAASSVTGSKVNVAGGSYTNVAPKQLEQMLANKDFAFINVHIPYEGEIANTDAFIPYDKIAENVGKLPADKNAKVVLYCRSGRMSAIAAEELIKRGYSNVWNLNGGMVAWEGAGLRVIQSPQ
ncbi:MAG TPA: rhodanese-like domain-containing protein [Anaerolineae bacterium]